MYPAGLRRWCRSPLDSGIWQELKIRWVRRMSERETFLGDEEGERDLEMGREVEATENRLK